MTPVAAGGMRKPKIPRAPSALEERLWWQIRTGKLPLPEREFRFHPTRKWRFDFAYPALLVAVECEGGVWAMGRHNRGSGFTEDCAKYNQAAILGWRVLRFTKEMIDSGQAFDAISRLTKNSALS